MLIDEPHSPDLQAGSDLTADDFSDRPDEIDVPIKAGDLLSATRVCSTPPTPTPAISGGPC